MTSIVTIIIADITILTCMPLENEDDNIKFTGTEYLRFCLVMLYIFDNSMIVSKFETR